MRQGLALVAVEEDDVAGFGLSLAQLKAQSHAFDLGGNLAAFQRVPGPPPTEVFFRNALDNCDLPILTPSRASISAMRRGIVQLGRSATGASSRGATTRSAASVFTGGGPGATVAFNASTPPRANSLRQRRTVSSRTLKASAMRGLVHPDNVSNIARARSASPRPREWANVSSALRCWSPAVTRDLPATPRLREFNAKIESHLRFVGQAEGVCLDYTPRELRLAIVAASQNRLGTLGDRILLLCSALVGAGRYTNVVMLSLRIAGAAATAGLCGSIFLMTRRSRR